MDEVNREGRQLIDSVRRHDGLAADRREQLKRGVMLGVSGAVGVGALGVASHAAAASVPAASAAQLASSAGAVGAQLSFGKVLFIAATGGVIGTGLLVATLPPAANVQPTAQVQSQHAPRVLGGSSARGGVAEKHALSAPGSSDAKTPSAQFAPVPAGAAPNRVGPVQASKPGMRSQALKAVEAAPLPPENRARSTAPLPSVASFSSANAPLDQELQTIRSAQRALREGKGQEVLNSLNQSQPPQVLTEEYAATRVFALCSSGRIAEGQSAARAFLNTYPRSPLRPKVANACSGK